MTPEEEKKAKEEILGGEKKKEEPMSEKREVSVEQLRIPFIKPPAPPSEVSSQVLDDEGQPQSKKPARSVRRALAVLSVLDSLRKPEQAVPGADQGALASSPARGMATLGAQRKERCPPRISGAHRGA